MKYDIAEQPVYTFGDATNGINRIRDNALAELEGHFGRTFHGVKIGFALFHFLKFRNGLYFPQELSQGIVARGLERA